METLFAHFRRRITACAALLLLVGWLAPMTAPAANTPGAATFRVTTVTYGGQYGPRHVMAIWVADANTNFVKTLEKRAANRQQYLYKWIAARGNWTAVDGISSATINTHQTHTVTWDCKTTNGVVVPDGTYRFMVEFTEANAQGRWTTSSVPFVKGTAPLTNTPANLANFTGMQLTFLPASHDIASLSLGPSIGSPNGTVSLQVRVTNLTDFVESFTVIVTNVTSGGLIGSQPVSNLAGRTATTVALNWNTAGLSVGNYILKATAGPLPGEAFTGDNSVTNTVSLRNPIHDVGIARVSGPAQILINSTASLTLTATNAGDFAETFAVTFRDLTDGTLVGTANANNLAPFASVNLTVPYNATNAAPGYHTLQAVAAAVPGETLLANNTNSLAVPISYGTTNVILVSTGSVWRYNDTGVDLGASAWKELSYPDASWASGAAPFGYGDTGITTTNNFGGVAANKFPAYYFRKKFLLDLLPTAMNLRARRDDGVVLYLNGAEVLRNNMPAGAIAHGTWATAAISGTAEFTYNSFAITPTNLSVGENVLAIELHQATADSSDLSLDVELSASQPNLPVTHRVNVAEVQTAGDALAGDWINVIVVLTNAGNVTETFTLYLRDQVTGQIVASQLINHLAPNATVLANLTWRTLGASVGSHPLQAFTVVGGLTNLAGAGTTTGVITGSGLALNAVNAAGSIGGFCSAVTLTTNRLVAGAGATLEILDITAPAAPVRLGSLRLPGIIEDIAIAGSNAFVACGNAGVQIVDISNPALPVHLSTFNSSGHAYDVAVSGSTLFLADGKGGVRALNVSSPTNPTLAGAFYTKGPARSIVVSGTTGYVLDSYEGLQILNVANPAAITLRGSYGLIEAGQALAVSGTTVYAIDGNGKFLIVNAANPAAPTLSGALLLSGLGQSLALDGNRAYVAAGGSGVIALDVSTPATPAVLATIATPDVAAAIAQSGSVAYVAVGFAGLRVLDLHAPQSPVALADVEIGFRGADVALANNLAYIAAGESGLRIFAVTNPARPVLIGTLAAATNARCIAVSGTLACLGDSQAGLKLVNVATPTAPVLVGSFNDTNFGSIRSLAISGSQIVFTDGRTIGLLDASTPAVPVLRSSYAAPAFAYAVVVAEGRVAAACGNHGVIFFNLAPNALTYAGTFDTPGHASGVTISGSRAMIADGPAGWSVLDISTPGAPTLLANSAADGSVQAVASTGTLFTFAGGTNQVVALDNSIPLTPVSGQTFGPLVRALRIAAGGSLAITAEDEAGLAILQLGGPETDADGDGLPDAWEQLIIDANPNDAITSIQDVTTGADFDGDGLSNYAEFLAGTLPVDASSVFAVACTTTPGGGPASLRWNSVAGKLYTVYKSTNLLTGFQAIQTDILGTPPINTFNDSTTNGIAFYMIGVH